MFPEISEKSYSALRSAIPPHKKGVGDVFNPRRSFIIPYSPAVSILYERFRKSIPAMATKPDPSASSEPGSGMGSIVCPEATTK